MSKTLLEQLAEFGQSIWLDNINSALIDSGELSGMITGGLRGVTSNPSIFHQAISQSKDYDEQIKDLHDKKKSAFEIYDELTVSDIASACNEFSDVYTSTKGLDGYVSLEINPLWANEVDKQIEEGIRLFKKVNKPNVMIKVPSTTAGYKVIEALIAQGINVNATLIFSLKQYEEVANAYLRGISTLVEKKGDPSKVRSVASVFVSRIDTAVDDLIEERLKSEASLEVNEKLLASKGTAAIANSRMVFEKSKEIFASGEFKVLEEKGANVQRVLWASTGTKNPKYSDIKYVKELIAAPTVNTVPTATLNAFIDHGDVKEALDTDVNQAVETVEFLGSIGISVDEICEELLEKGVVSFSNAFEALLSSIEEKAISLDGSAS